MALPSVHPRLRHFFIAFLFVAVGLSTLGSIINTLKFDSVDSPQSTGKAPAQDKAYFSSFKLTSASQTDTSATDVVVVSGQDVSFSAQVEGVRQLLLVVRPSSGDAFNVTAQPDSHGSVSAKVRLPETGTVYTVQAYGYVKDKLIPGWEGGAINNRAAVIAESAIRVVVRKP